jgi:hypothetical protein
MDMCYTSAMPYVCLSLPYHSAKIPLHFYSAYTFFCAEFWNYVNPCIQTSIMLSYSELFIRLIAVLTHLGEGMEF